MRRLPVDIAGSVQLAELLFYRHDFVQTDYTDQVDQNL